MDYVNKKMDPWERIVPPFHFDPELSFVNIVVPTVDTIRYSYLLDKLLAVNTSVMFTGGTGQSGTRRDTGSPGRESAAAHRQAACACAVSTPHSCCTYMSLCGCAIMFVIDIFLITYMNIRREGSQCPVISRH